jgi:glutamate N-acetyltransferase/amino-acid N-acetyltransferase
MATMLAFIVTDAVIEKNILLKFLKESTDSSFNMITIDGDTSTNDTVIILANKSAKNEIITEASPSSKIFLQALNFVTSKLARMIVKDGEGATKIIEVNVKGGKAIHDAKAIAFAIAQSNLVKTAFFGEDANWGRIIAAAGTAGVSFEPDKIDIFFGQVQVVKNGIYCGARREKEINDIIKKRDIALMVDLNSGDEEARVLTCDLSFDYVKINAEYRT